VLVAVGGVITLYHAAHWFMNKKDNRNFEFNTICNSIPYILGNIVIISAEDAAINEHGKRMRELDASKFKGKVVLADMYKN
jgi:hypothetical protein